MKALILLLAASVPLLSQDPYDVAGNHYRLAFENPWVRATRVVYGPHETAPVHNHPPNPVTVYVYVTDGGVMQFHHVTGNHIAGFTIDRKPVLAGAIRVAHGAPETHTVKYLGDQETEYARLELRTEPLDRPTRDVRLVPNAFTEGQQVFRQFENGQLRIVRMRCDAMRSCPASEHLSDPAVIITLNGPTRGEIRWSAPGENKQLTGPLELVRIELKSPPVKPE